jgi:hypothetical protein
MKVVGREGIMVVSCAAWRETLYDRKNFNSRGSETQDNTHVSKVGGRKLKKVQYLINKWIKQYNRRGKKS